MYTSGFGIRPCNITHTVCTRDGISRMLDRFLSLVRYTVHDKSPVRTHDTLLYPPGELTRAPVSPEVFFTGYFLPTLNRSVSTTSPELCTHSVPRDLLQFPVLRTRVSPTPLRYSCDNLHLSPDPGLRTQVKQLPTKNS